MSRIAAAADILRQGGLVVYPTETFYALGANSCDPQAISRLLKLKGRGAQHPLPLITANAKHLKDYCSPGFAWAGIQPLMREFWPGPLTLVLPAAATLHPALLSPPLLANSPFGVAVRIPAHAGARQLAASLGRAVISTSANLSGRPAAASPAELDRQLLAGVDMVLDGGVCAGGLPSTILDVRAKPPRLLRQGILRLPVWALNGE